jgi:putative hemolysin
MLIELQVLLALTLVASLLVMSILDFALGRLNKIALRRITDHSKQRPGAFGESLTETPEQVQMAIHIAIQTLLIALAVLLSWSALALDLHYAVALPSAGGVTLILVLVFRQLLPRAIVLHNPEAVLERLIPVLVVPYYLMAPIVGTITAILNRFKRWEAVEDEEEDEASEEEIRAFIDVGQEEGILEQDEGELIQSIVEFGDKVALEVMTPRTQIVAADLSWSADRVVNLILARRHSRIPIYREQLDNIEGIVHERDLLGAIQSGDKPENLRPLLQSVHFVPETKPIDDLLEEMKGHGQQLVLVVDEYGGISGLITIEDLVEEIVGEIGDGPESASETLRDEGSGRYVVPGGMELDAMDSKLGVEIFPKTESTTVGGAVVELFGRLPSPGDRIQQSGYVIEVIEADRRRVRSVRIRTMSPKAGAGS